VQVKNSLYNQFLCELFYYFLKGWREDRLLDLPTELICPECRWRRNQSLITHPVDFEALRRRESVRRLDLLFHRRSQPHLRQDRGQGAGQLTQVKKIGVNQQGIVFATLHFLPNVLSWKVLLRVIYLLYPFMSYEENKVLWIRPQVLYSRHFIFFITQKWAE